MNNDRPTALEYTPIEIHTSALDAEVRTLRTQVITLECEREADTRTIVDLRRENAMLRAAWLAKMTADLDLGNVATAAMQDLLDAQQRELETAAVRVRVAEAERDDALANAGGAEEQLATRGHLPQCDGVRPGDASVFPHRCRETGAWSRRHKAYRCAACEAAVIEAVAL